MAHKKSGESLAAARGRGDQDMFTIGDAGPGKALGPGGGAHLFQEPFGYQGVEQTERRVLGCLQIDHRSFFFLKLKNTSSN